jgi:hypothetical protein
MQNALAKFLREAAESLRDMALNAPKISNELRRFADELEKQARRLRQRDETSDDG